MSAHLKSLARRLNPVQIPLFPLKGTVLLPGCELPLNIFEPRYLNMIDDALRNDRLIGIIQPALKELQGSEGERARGSQSSDLSKVGTLGRIKQYSETDDGRYLISMVGLKRFDFVSDANSPTPYRQGLVSYESYAEDPNIFSGRNLPQAMTEKCTERADLIAAMKGFAKILSIEIDWPSLDGIPIEHLVDQCTMIGPFAPADKQSLLEAPSAERRRHLIIGLMTLYSTSHNDQNSPSQNRKN